MSADTGTPASAQTDNRAAFLCRAWSGPEALRAKTAADGTTMVGHFAVFDTWTEIKSIFEGNFLERIAPGAFADTFKERGDQIRVLYDHGADPTIGNKPLGAPTVLKEDSRGAYYEVDLFDSSYVNDLKPAIRAGQLGASFRFKVTADAWAQPKEPSRDNPQMLEERTITGVDLYEFGPVTFPAYPDASAGLRSRTDEFIEHFLNDPAFLARFKERAGPAVVDQIRESIPASTTSFGTSVGATATTYTSTFRTGTPTAAPGTEAPTAPTETSTTTDPTADGGSADLQARKANVLAKTKDFLARTTKAA